MSDLLAYLVSEYRQDVMPDVPFAPGIDVSKLTAGDVEPLFVRLPILKVGGKSDKGFTWGEPDVDRVVSEINIKRPEGNFGHVRPEDRSHKYDMGKVRWVGAVRVGDTAYAKAYVPKYAQDAREYFRVAEAAQARVGTSVYGRRGKAGLRDMTLETLDFGHPDRLGFEGAAVVPVLMSEFEGTEKVGQEDQEGLISELKNDRATLNLVVSELKLDAKNPLQAAKSLVSEIADLRKQHELLGSIISELKLDAEKPLVTVKALVTELAEHQRAAMVGEVDALIAEMTKENETIRPFIREYVIETRDGREVSLYADKDALKARLDGLLKSDHIQNLAKTLVSEGRGPNAFVPGRKPEDAKTQRDQDVEAGYKRAAKMGYAVNGNGSNN